MTMKFIIVGAARTGSTLLVRTLNSLGDMCCHGELLGATQVRGYEDNFDPQQATQAEREARTKRLLKDRTRDPLEFVQRALTSDAKATGFKMLYREFLNPQWQEARASLFDTPGIRFIHLTRGNHLRRFVSEQILLAGGPNHSGAGGRSEKSLSVHIDIPEFLQSIAEVEASAREISSILSNQQVLDITYEELALDTAGTVVDVCKFLDIPVAPANISPALKKVGSTDLSNSVSNYQELLDDPATRALALSQ
jgi:LPS sulfotransferase NodH